MFPFDLLILSSKRKVSSHVYTLSGRGRSSAMSSAGPNYSIAYYFFSYYLHISRPVFFHKTFILRKISKCSNIVAKCIYPYINNMLVVKRHLYSPVKCSSSTDKSSSPAFMKLFSISFFLTQENKSG